MTDTRNRWFGKYSSEPTNAFFHELAIESSDEHVSKEEGGCWWATTFSDGVAPEDIDEWHEKWCEEHIDRMDAETITHLCSQTVYVIVHEDSQGFVGAEIYNDKGRYVAEWQEIVDDATIEECGECGGEADSYGKGEPPVHDVLCSQYTSMIQ